MATFRPTAREIFVELKSLVEEKRANDPEFSCIYRFNIKPSASWVLEVYPVQEGDSTQPCGKVFELGIDEEPNRNPDCTLTYEDEDVFIDLSTNKLSPQKAFIKRKLVIKGNMAKMRFLRELMEKGQRRRGAGGAAAAAAVLPQPKSAWEPDGARRACAICARRFRVTVRRHHCRFCGRVVCAGCSGHRAHGRRACGRCAAVVLAAAAGAGAAAAPRGGAAAAALEAELVRERTATVVSEAQDVEVLKQQVTDLRDQVEELQLQDAYARARRALLGVGLLHAALLALAVLAYLGLAHLLAGRLAPLVGRRGLALLDGGYEGEGPRLPAAGWAGALLRAALAPAHRPALRRALFAYFVALGLFYHKVITRGLLPRRLKTLTLAAVAILWLRRTRRLCKPLSAGESARRWERCHRVLSPFMYLGILGLKGLWVKAGQYLSSRADVMPLAFVQELQKLQDAVPPSAVGEVKKTVERGLGKPVGELFSSFEDAALAAASIAQVHRATLPDGQEVVVKVQHPEVQFLMLEDIRNIRLIVTVVAFFEPEFDFRVIMDEWTRGVRRELDFRVEAENLQRVHAAMQRSGQNVEIPRLVPDMVSRKVVVMSFCAGWKVTERERLDRLPHRERERLMKKICEAFAYQMHVDGLFNGDPHPGNILVQAREVDGGRALADPRPVLLDWGLAKAFGEQKRLAFAKFVYATAELDFVSMLAAFEEMGVKLNRFDPAEDMHNTRHMFRDTAPPEEARSAHKKWERKWAKKRRADYRATGRKNPVDAYPGDLLFFVRATELLHGLGARLRVRVPYIQVIAPFARRALRDAVPPGERARGAVHPSPCLSPLEVKVRRLAAELIDRGLLTGCQVAVRRHGVPLVATCAGTQGPVDPRPVTPRTLFCALSVSKAVLATAVHALADRGKVDYDAPVTAYWPAFAGNGKAGVTVRHALTHCAGLQHALLDAPTFDDLCDWPKVRAALEEAAPVWEPGSRCSYHYFTFGWLLAGVVEGASGLPLAEAVRSLVAAPLGLEDEMFLGDVGARGVAPERLAALESDLAKRMQEQASSHGPGDEEDEEEDDDKVNMAGLAFLAAGIKEEDEAEGRALEELARKLRGREYLLDPRMFNYPPLRDAVFPAANGHFTARALAVLFDRLLADATRPGRRGSTPPDFGTGRGGDDGGERGERAGAAAAGEGGGGGGGGPAASGGAGEGGEGGGGGDGGGRPPVLLRRETLAQARKVHCRDRASYLQLFGQAEGVRYGLGYQIMGFRDDVPDEDGGKREGHVRFTAMGHTGASGSIAFCDPVTGLVFAMTVNKIVEGHQGTKAILELVCKELGCGTPVSVFSS